MTSFFKGEARLSHIFTSLEAHLVSAKEQAPFCRSLRKTFPQDYRTAYADAATG